jgi:hypothetical protein
MQWLRCRGQRCRRLHRCADRAESSARHGERARGAARSSPSCQGGSVATRTPGCVDARRARAASGWSLGAGTRHAFPHAVAPSGSRIPPRPTASSSAVKNARVWRLTPGGPRRRRPASVDAANEWGHGEGPGVACASPKETGVVRRLRRAGPGSALSAPSVYSLRPNSLDARRGRLRASRVRLACRTVVQLTAAQQYGSKVGLLRSKWTVRQRAFHRDRSSARAIMVLASARIRFSASESGFHL